MRAKRFKCTAGELVSGYGHSHVDDCIREWSESICMGDTDFAESKNKLSLDYLPEKFELFLFQIDNFVGWESIEGGPYIRMDNIHTNLAQEASPSDTIVSITTSAILRRDLNLLDCNSGSTRQVEIDYDSIEEFIQENELIMSQLENKYVGVLEDSGTFRPNVNESSRVKELCSDFIESEDLFVEGLYSSFKIKPEVVDEEVKLGDRISPKLLWAVQSKLNIKLKQFIKKRELYGSDFFKG
jgi:hypothetical protein